MKCPRTGRRGFSFSSVYALLALTCLVEAVPIFDIPQRHLSDPSDSFLDDGLDTDLPPASASPWRDAKLWQDPPKQESTVRKIAGRFAQRVLRSAGAEPQMSMSSKALSQHSDDVVLRFKTATANEREQLMKASTELFLDVWSITQEHVDVRISKSTVSHASSRPLP